MSHKETYWWQSRSCCSSGDGFHGFRGFHHLFVLAGLTVPWSKELRHDSKILYHPLHWTPNCIRHSFTALLKHHIQTRLFHKEAYKKLCLIFDFGISFYVVCGASIASSWVALENTTRCAIIYDRSTFCRCAATQRRPLLMLYKILLENWNNRGEQKAPAKTFHVREYY